MASRHNLNDILIGKKTPRRLFVKLIPVVEDRVNAVGTSITGDKLNLRRLKNNLFRVIMLKRDVKSCSFRENMSNEDLEAAKVLESLSCKLNN